MIEETSSGGVVIFKNTILLLKKYNGDWVLPKGRVEKGEMLKTTALREVLEESCVKGEIIDYIGNINYHYKNNKTDEMVSKTVHWYLMRSNSMNCTPQRNEGFVEALFVYKYKAKEILRYEDEKKILRKSLQMIKNI